MTDDQDQASLRVQPRLQRLIADKGTTFANSFATNPVCCPSRSSFLTGRYSHNTGVLRNSPPFGGFAVFDDSDTLAVRLQDSGYHTGLIGKYLNGYGYPDQTYIPPGWSEWYGAVDPGTYRMYGYTLNENGTPVTYGDYDTPDPALYQTDVYAQKAVDYIAGREGSASPFFLQISTLAPHTEVYQRPDDGDDDPPTPDFPNPRPAPRDVGAFATESLIRGPSFNEANVSDKPEPVRLRPPMSPGAISMARKRNRSRLASLLAVDDLIARVVRELRATDELNDTILLYTSDNGFQLGQHRIPNGKQQPYEESLRVPLIMRGPGIPRGEVRRQQAANIDLAPTIAELAGATLDRPVDGRSLLGLVADSRERDGRAIVIENWCQTNEACFDPEVPRYRGVRTDRFKYVRYPNGEEELYDLERDPIEIRSRHADSEYVVQRRALSRLLDEIAECSGRPCRIRPDVGLAADYQRRGRCVASGVVVTPSGADGRRAIAATLRLTGAQKQTDEERPIRLRIDRSSLPATGRIDLDGTITAVDGRVRDASISLPRAC